MESCSVDFLCVKSAMAVFANPSDANMRRAGNLAVQSRHSILVWPVELVRQARRGMRSETATQ